MVVHEESTYSGGGRTTIQIDKTTRENLHKAAALAGYPNLSDYLRDIGKDAISGKQLPLGTVSRPIDTKITRLASAVINMANIMVWIEEMRNPGSMNRFIDKGEVELDAMSEYAKAFIKSKAASMKAPQLHLPEFDNKEISPT